MADLGSVRADLDAAFDAAFGAAEPTVLRLHDNEPSFGQQGNGHFADSPNTPDPRTGEWVRIHTEVGPGRNVEIGGDYAENIGRFEVLIHVALGTGTARADALAKTVNGIVQAFSIAGVHMRASDERGGSADVSNTWFVVTVSTPFRLEFAP